MGYLEIAKKIQDLYKERDEYDEQYRVVHEKYSKMADAEFPWSDYLEKHREFSKKLAEYHKELNDAEDKPDGRQRNTFLTYILSDECRKKYEEERKNKVCPSGIHTTEDKPDTTEKAKDLQERLVQCCIDYILETGDRDIYSVNFGADSLQESATFGKWVPDTDSYITINSLCWDKEQKTTVIEETGRYC